MKTKDLEAQLSHASEFRFHFPWCDMSLTPSIVKKASPAAADNTGTTYDLDSGLEWEENCLVWTLPASATGTAGVYYWRLDLTDDDSNKLAKMGGSLIVRTV